MTVDGTKSRDFNQWYNFGMKVHVDRTRIWRHLTDFWTLLSFLIIGANFIKEGELEYILGPVLAIYVAVLAIFSAEKEFERWHWRTNGKHIGELYVWLWTVLIVGILAVIYFTHSEYRIEEEVYSTYIVVLGILAITRKSKEMFKEIDRKSP